jgi:hypothetical protein
VVVAVGDTETDPEAVPGNDGMAVFPSDPGEMQDGALVDDHDRVEDAPEVIDDGLALKPAVAGALTLEAEKKLLNPGALNASAGTHSTAANRHSNRSGRRYLYIIGTPCSLTSVSQFYCGLSAKIGTLHVPVPPINCMFTVQPAHPEVV